MLVRFVVHPCHDSWSLVSDFTKMARRVHEVVFYQKDGTSRTRSSLLPNEPSCQGGAFDTSGSRIGVKLTKWTRVTVHQTLGVEQKILPNPNVSRFCEHELIWNMWICQSNRRFKTVLLVSLFRTCDNNWWNGSFLCVHFPSFPSNMASMEKETQKMKTVTGTKKCIQKLVMLSLTSF